MPLAESLVDLNEADKAGLTSMPHLHDFAISGPYTCHRSGRDAQPCRIFASCYPTSQAKEEFGLPCARKIIWNLDATQAYRRPVSDSDVERAF